MQTLSQKLITKHQWLVHSLYGQKYWDTPFFRRESAFKVTPEVFSWDQDLSFCRPVKFFHTDWIIISLWSLSYTQRHCHVRIEKGSVQTLTIKLEAHNSLEYNYMLKPNLFSKNENVLKMYSPSGYPKCRFVFFFIRRYLEKCSNLLTNGSSVQTAFHFTRC